MENENEINNNVNSNNSENFNYDTSSKFQVVTDSRSKNNFNNYSTNSKRKSSLKLRSGCLRIKTS